MSRPFSSPLPAACEQHLSSYVSAALAGIGVLSASQVADAQVLSTLDANQTISNNGMIYLFAGAGFAVNSGPELTLAVTGFSVSSYTRVAGVHNLNVLTAGGSYFAKDLAKGSTVGPMAGNFVAAGVMRLGEHTVYSGATEQNQGHFHGLTGYLGFSFTDPNNSAETDYGWAQITESANQNTLTLVSAAYEVGGPIVVGQVPEPGSLALLAGGAGCLAAWRLRNRRRGEWVSADAPAC